MNFLTNVSIVVLAGVLTNQAIAGQSMTVQGRLLNSDGTALTSSAVQFNVQIRSSGVEDCLLYEESQTLNLSITQGAFAITVGQGTRSAVSVDGGNPLNSIFSNSKTISLSAANSPCANADTSYTPTATDNRILVLTYDDGSGWDSIPAIPLSWVPQAMYAQDSEKLSGVDGSQYLKVAPGVTASALSSNDYTKLTSLVAGTNSSYVQTANLPVCGAGEFISAAAGGVLSCQSVSGASGGTVTNVTSANSYLTVTTGTSTPSLTLNVGTAANTVAAGNDSRITNALQSGAAAGGDLSGTYPNPTITNGAVTAAKLGSDVGLWSISGSDVYRAGGNVGIGTTTPLSKLHISSAAVASTHYPLFALGSGAFDGATAGFYNGNANGTVIGVNTASGYVGDFANFQIAGVTKFRIDSSGNISANGTTSSAGNISTTGNITTTGTGTITSNGVMYAASGAASTSPSTGALVVSGGLGVSGDQYLGGSFNMSGSSSYTQNFTGTTNNAANISANNLTSGSILNLSSTSTESTDGQTGLNISISGANTNSGVTRYGIQSSVISTGTTSTNIGASFSASGASNNYGLLVPDGNVGIGTSAPGEVLQVAGNVRVGKSPSPLTTLSGAVLAGDALISVVSTAGYPSSGTLQIDSEAMTYTGVTPTSFTGLTRGVYGTTAAGHLTGKSVYAYLFAVQGSSINPAFSVLSNNAVAIGAFNATNSSLGSNSLSVGAGVRATGTGSFALGNSSTIASGGGSFAAGNFAQATGSDAVATGFHPVASGAESVAHGYQAKATGNYSMAVGENTTAAAQDSFVIGRYNVGGGSGAAWVATDPIFEIGIGTGTGINAADAMTVLKNGNVGIGVTSPAYKLDVNGDVNIAAANVLRFGTTQVCTSAGCTSSSDRRLKKNIKPLNNALNKVLKLEGVTYEWKDKNKYGHGQQVGLIAQDLEVVYPEVVVTDPKSGFKSVAYDHLIAPLIEAIKELNGQIKDLFKSSDDHSKAIAALKAEVEAKGHQVELLQAENATLKNRLEKIEKVLQAKGK